jgi:hypothetical protein
VQQNVKLSISIAKEFVVVISEPPQIPITSLGFVPDAKAILISCAVVRHCPEVGSQMRGTVGANVGITVGDATGGGVDRLGERVGVPVLGLGELIGAGTGPDTGDRVGSLVFVVGLVVDGDGGLGIGAGIMNGGNTGEMGGLFVGGLVGLAPLLPLGLRI